MAMTSQLVAQLEDLFNQYGTINNSSLFQLRRNRWHVLSDDDDAPPKYCGLTMATGVNFAKSELWEPSPMKKCRTECNQEKLPVPAGDKIVMDKEIWKQFPEDLFEVLIARLPIEAFFRFRSVCRKWNALPESESFSKHCTQILRTEPWFYTVTHGSNNYGALYDPSSMKWHQPSISSFPEKMIVLPVASAGGLMCFIDIGQRSFYVCNPLTQSFKELPTSSVKVWWHIAVGMTFDDSAVGHGYKIVWVSSVGDYEVYDSQTLSWKQPTRMPPYMTLPLSLNLRSQTISIDNNLYFMRSDPEGIVSYDASTGVWKQFIIPSPLYLCDHTLAECGGRIMLAGLVTKNAATCLCIWELQKMTLLWKEVDRMPNIWCLDFYGKHVTMTCLGNKGMLLLSLRSKQYNLLVTYNISSREWIKIPFSHHSRGRKRQWIVSGAAFYPCVTSLA